MRRVLRYPGSKWKIARQLVSLIPPHHSYVEPYFGSGAILFNKPLSDIETVNDLNSDVVNLYWCMQRDAEHLAHLVATTPYSREVYEQECLAASGKDPYEQALSFLIRSWQGYGFRADGSKNGWRNDVVGRERAYAVRDWIRLPDWILDIWERLQFVQIEHRPALEVIERFNYPQVFMYLDPPYLLDTRSAGRKQYKDEMTDEDHKELLQVLQKSQAKIMISGYASELYEEYLKDWRKIAFQSCSEMGHRRTEIVWMNYSDSQTDFTERMKN